MGGNSRRRSRGSRRRSRSRGGGGGVRWPNDPTFKKIPKDMLDKRFHGTLKAFFKDKGFGFIECGETRDVFKRDIFVDVTNLPADVSRVGDKVSFDLAIGRPGYPAAEN